MAFDRHDYLMFCRQPKVKLIPIRVDGSAVSTTAGTGGLLTGAKDVTVVKGTSADSNLVTITLNTASAREIHVVGVVELTADCSARLEELPTTSVVKIRTVENDASGTKKDDADFDITILVFEDADEV